MIRRVVIVGASDRRSKFGNKAVRAHLAAGWHVHPVHPTLTHVEDQPCVPTVAELPAEHFDRVTFYVPPSVGLAILPLLTRLDFAELLLNPGTHTPELLETARRLGLPVVTGCSIVALGYSPADFAE